MSACAGSCIGGPVMEKYHRSPVKDYMSVANFAGKKDFNVAQLNASEIKKQFNL
jgi:iron only hydrogenase large subunit-like protein